MAGIAYLLLEGGSPLLRHTKRMRVPIAFVDSQLRRILGYSTEVYGPGV